MSETAVLKAYSYLNELTQREHRGRHDTWGAARDRAAAKAGIPPSYAKRLWDRWQSMKDVSGGALDALREAYIRTCERSEAAEARQEARLERTALETSHEIALATALERREAGLGLGGTDPLASSSAALQRTKGR